MSALRLKFRSGVPGRIDVSALVPSRVARLSLLDAARLSLGGDGLALGDVFTVLGSPGDTIVIEGGSDALDFAGAGLDGGTVIVEGDAGAYAGKDMKSGRLEIRGNAGPWLASGLAGGIVSVTGSAAEYAGGQSAGAKYRHDRRHGRGRRQPRSPRRRTHAPRHDRREGYGRTRGGQPHGRRYHLGCRRFRR